MTGVARQVLDPTPRFTGNAARFQLALSDLGSGAREREGATSFITSMRNGLGKPWMTPPATNEASPYPGIVIKTSATSPLFKSTDEALLVTPFSSREIASAFLSRVTRTLSSAPSILRFAE
jgi:hypothetical protein